MNARAMQKTWSVALCLLTASFFSIVLFADFIPMPLGSYATQRFVLVCFLGLFVVLSFAFLIYRDGFRWIINIWPAAVLSIGFVLLALPFNKALFSWVEPGMYALFFLSFATISYGQAHDNFLWTGTYNFLINQCMQSDHGQAQRIS